MSPKIGKIQQIFHFSVWYNQSFQYTLSFFYKFITSAIRN